jgi:DNA-binding XRE family transcriptional regulator
VDNKTRQRIKKQEERELSRLLKQASIKQFKSNIYIMYPIRDVDDETIKQMYNLKPLGTKIVYDYDFRPIYCKPENVVNENNWEYDIKVYQKYNNINNLKPNIPCEILKENSNMKTIGERLKLYRKYHFLSQREMAKEIKTSATKISNVENNKAELSDKCKELFLNLEKKAKFAAIKWVFKSIYRFIISLPFKLINMVKNWLI